VTYTPRPELYDVEYGAKDYAAESEAVARVVRERNPEARTLLDVACGTGKHLEHLRAEFDCEGTDLDGGLLDVARERLPGVPLHEADMRSFDLGRRFDAVTCLFSAIGFVGGPDGLADAARAFARHLEPGGVLVIEPWIRPGEWIPNRPHLLTAENFARMTLSGLRDERISTTEMHYLLGSPERIEHFVVHHELYLFTDDEIRAALEGAGFRVEHDADGLIGRGLWIATS
jgi:SAM-dependent methyltransferase